MTNSVRRGVEAILSAIELAIDGRIEAEIQVPVWYPALISCLTLPDQCAAIENPGGVTNRDRYEGWFDRWRDASYVDVLTGHELYRHRCKMLHEALGFLPARDKDDPDQWEARYVGRYAHIAYLVHHEDGPSGLSHLEVRRNPHHKTRPEFDYQYPDALVLDAEIFCTDMVGSVRRWLSDPAAINRINLRTVFALTGNGPSSIGPFNLFT